MNKKERIYIDTLIIYTLWYDFWNYFDAQSDFGKKKLSQKSYSYLTFLT